MKLSLKLDEKMKLGIMQPYFLPYIGYFQLMKYVDKYVVYDDVNYIKGGWINRNNFLISNESRLLTIVLDGATPNKLICDIEIKDDFGKFLKTIRMNYSKAPFYRDVMPLLENICLSENRNLALFLLNSFRSILHYLNIDTELILSSSLNKNHSLKGKDKVIDICRLFCADTYVNAIGGQCLYNKDEFARDQIQLLFLKSSNDIVYRQFGTIYIPSLSFLDVLMFNSVEDTNLMLDNFELI